MSDIVGPLRVSLIEQIKLLRAAEGSTSPLVKGVDDGTDSTVSKPTEPGVKVSEMPYLEMKPIALATTQKDNIVRATVGLVLWTAGWDSSESDLFSSFMLTDFYSSTIRTLHFRDVKVEVDTMTRNHISSSDPEKPGPKVGLTSVSLSFELCKVSP